MVSSQLPWLRCLFGLRFLLFLLQLGIWGRLGQTNTSFERPVCPAKGVFPPTLTSACVPAAAEPPWAEARGPRLDGCVLLGRRQRPLLTSHRSVYRVGRGPLPLAWASALFLIAV